MRKSSVDPTKYVVLDVETNGLSSVRDDLLSISIYKPDTGEQYNRFLPLELNSKVMTTGINGIKTSDLSGLSPLSQKEVDDIIEKFQLKHRIILTYGGIDERFITKYLSRHHLDGIEYFAFYNFKHEIIASKFSEGNVTKDNLCKIYGIENVQDIHEGTNDCVLEWKLFEKMNGNRLLVTDNKVFEFNEEYIVPASYIATHPNFQYYLPELPQIRCDSHEVFSLTIPGSKLKRLPTNFNGMLLEHLIDSMLTVKRIDSEEELIKNKSKLRYIGKLPSTIEIVPLMFNMDGTMTAVRAKDKKIVQQINKNVSVMKAAFEPLIKYIADNIFEGEPIRSQELVVHPEKRVLALCDLSSDSAVLEIKSNDSSYYAEQLYYQANGRRTYVLQTTIDFYRSCWVYTIKEVVFSIVEPFDRRKADLEKAKQKVDTEEVKLVSYTDTKTPVRLRCEICGSEWNTSYRTAIKHGECPECRKKKKQAQTELQRQENRFVAEEEKSLRKKEAFQKKLDERSGNSILVLDYADSYTPVHVKCRQCGYEWTARSDYLLARASCKKCRQLARKMINAKKKVHAYE